jgi:hypothetical protein
MTEIDWPTVGTMLFGGFLTLLGTLVAELIRSWVKMRKGKEKLLRRILLTLRSIRDLCDVYKDRDPEAKMIPALLREMVQRWHGFDRVADDMGLLKKLSLEIEIEDVFDQARVIAEKIIDDEKEAEDYLRMVGTHESADAALLVATAAEGANVRKKNLEELGKLHTKVEALIAKVVPLTK